MGTLPTGTVTFLFTDIEGSTQLWERHPEAMKTALARHDSILKEAIEFNQGHIIKTTGDGVHAVFSTAIDAINTAIVSQSNLQSQITNLQLRVRMGLHTGEAELRAGDYYGQTLNRVARIMEVAYGGQILLSAITLRWCATTCQPAQTCSIWANTVLKTLPVLRISCNSTRLVCQPIFSL